jgi:hypothetical protein
MNATRPQLDEMSNNMMARRRILENVKRRFADCDDPGALRETIRFLEHVQATDESVMGLHRECLSMVDLCQRALTLEALRQPLVVTLPPASLPKRKGEQKLERLHETSSIMVGQCLKCGARCELNTETEHCIMGCARSRDPFASKPLLWGKHCRQNGCDDFNEQCPSCACACAACKPTRPDNASSVGDAKDSAVRIVESWEERGFASGGPAARDAMIVAITARLWGLRPATVDDLHPETAGIDFESLATEVWSRINTRDFSRRDLAEALREAFALVDRSSEKKL